MTSTGKLTAGVLEFLAKCDKCNRPRNSGNHDKCSRARQQEYSRLINRKNAADVEQD